MHDHLVQAGIDKLVSWFGKDMFLDLCKDGELDADTTPTELLEHLEETCCTNVEKILESIEDFLEERDP